MHWPNSIILTHAYTLLASFVFFQNFQLDTILWYISYYFTYSSYSSSPARISSAQTRASGSVTVHLQSPSVVSTCQARATVFFWTNTCQAQSSRHWLWSEKPEWANQVCLRTGVWDMRHIIPKIWSLRTLWVCIISRSGCDRKEGDDKVLFVLLHILQHVSLARIIHTKQTTT